MNSKIQLAVNLQPVPAERIKQAVIKYLNTENTSNIDWENTLSQEVVNFQQWIETTRRKLNP